MIDASSPQALETGDLDEPLSTRSADSLGFVMDVPVELCVEIGRRVMRLGELLKLGPGSVLELDKLSGEPLDIYANRKLVARGEAVVIGERYGVRLSEVLVVDDPPSSSSKPRRQ
ncbi:MAG: flagellar motor switch protein FliN [Deltaproteobacteria bacterium]